MDDHFIEFFLYLGRVLSLAWIQTKRLTNWLGIPGVVLLFFPGATFHYYASNFNWMAVLEEFDKFLFYSVASGLGLMALGFIYNLIVSPYQLDSWQRKETKKYRDLVESRERIEVLLEQLAAIRNRGVRIRNRPIQLTDYGAWKIEYDAWALESEAKIRELSKSEATLAQAIDLR